MISASDPILLLGFAMLVLGFFWLAGMGVGWLLRLRGTRVPLKAACGVLVVVYLVIATFFGQRLVRQALPSNGIDDALGTVQDPVSPAYAVTIARVIDGDTFELSTGDKIRVLGINTPETVDPRREVECFGPEASARAKELLEGELVTLSPDITQDSEDRYGRLLRYVELGDGTDVALTLITEGLAFEYTYDVPYERQAAYMAAEDAAKDAARGIWSEVCAQ